MQCYESGELFVLPRAGGAENLFARWSDRELGGELRILYSVEDILRHYELKTDDLRKQFGAFPFVARVPDGMERELAFKYQRDQDVAVAIPNFHVGPLAGVPEINEPVVSEAVSMLACEARSPICGSGVKVAVIDTGVDARVLNHPSRLLTTQFATDTPAAAGAGLTPHDPVGHGSTVAHIINRIAPSAEIMSVKMMDRIGNVGGLIAAVYLAEAEFRPDIYNLSLSLTCDVDFCGSCGYPQGSQAAVTALQLELLFGLLDKREMLTGNRPLIVAAAGNNGLGAVTRNVRMPARFPNVLAVGSYDMEQGDTAPYSVYPDTPHGRYVLAPGGLDDQPNCIARKPRKFSTRDDYFFGTSFSAAFVTGIAARYLCAAKGQAPCSLTSIADVAGLPEVPTRAFLMNCLAETAVRHLPGYSPTTHGWGLASYDYEAARSFALTFSRHP